MKRFGVLAFSFLLLAACDGFPRTEHSAEMRESAEVVDLIYMPDRHGSGSGPTIGLDGSVGIAITSVSIPEKYAVVFRCPHGKFVIQDDQKKAKEMWHRLRVGQQVTIYYRETYRVRHKNRVEIKRVLVKYDFMDAR